jgi:hypothetical protein
MARWNKATAFGLLAVLGTGCRAEPPAAPPPTPAPSPPPPRPRAPVAPHWRYHPHEPARMHAGVRLANGAWLLAGDLGERWLTEPIAEPPEERLHRARASEHRAPESLRAVAERPDGGWLFVGESGSVYGARGPLDALEPSAVAPEPLAQVAAAGGVLVGLGSLGATYRFDGGRWSAGASPPARPFDVAATATGKLLALAAPEALFASDDGGASWRAVAVEPVGALALVRVADGGVLVQAAARDLYWSGGAARSARGETRLLLPAERGVHIGGAAGPSALAVREGRAVLTARRSYALEPTHRAGAGAWRLRVTTLDGDGEERATPLASCEGARLGASGAHLVAACLGRPFVGGPLAVALHRSADGGERWSPAGTLVAPEAAPVALAVTESGEALVTGACTTGEIPCAPRAPHRLGRAGEIEPALAADLVGPATSPAFATSGGAAFFLGKRVKDGRVSLFVSEDGGRRFVSRALAARGGWDPDKAPPRALSPGDGVLGIVAGEDGLVYALADHEGNVVSVARPPEGTLALAGFGRAVLAVGQQGTGAGPVVLSAWESVDGGQSFAPIAIPMRLELDELDDELALACAAGGCVLGSRATRVGWAGGGEAVAADPPRADPEPEPALAATVSCTLEPGGAWSAVSHVAEGLPLVPGAAQAMRGKSAWSVLRFDDATGEVTALSAPVGAPAAKLVSSRLLAPSRQRARLAYAVRPQMEGFAAVRAELPRAGKPSEPVSIARLEAAWINHETGELGRRTLGEAGVLDPDDVTPGERPHLLAPLVSVSPGVLFVRPSGSQSDVLLLDLTGARDATLRYPEWPPTRWQARGDAAIVAGQPFAVALHHKSGEGASAAPIVALAKLHAQAGGAAGPVAPSYYTVGPPSERERRLETRWSYRGREIGVTVHVLDRASARAHASFLPFSADGRLGASEPLGTQADAGAQARGCGDAERAASARLVAPFVPGSRRLVTVQTPGGIQHLLTGAAVLYGKPEATCVAAWEALSLRGSPEALAALIAGDLSHGWLFRRLANDRRGFEYHAVRCEPAPGAAVPAAVWGEPGTTRWRR